MKKVIFITLIVACTFEFIPERTQASTEKPPCFDFNQVIKTPLSKVFTTPSEKDLTESGKLKGTQRTIWSAAQGLVNQPIQKLYQALLNHYTIKDPKRVALKVYPQERPGYQDFHLIMIKALIPIFDIRWEEEWAYLISRGTSVSPEEIVISYQKTNGTSYIPHLCGSIVLNKDAASRTRVFLYEEIDALGKRTPQDSVKGHLGTLTTLRKNN